MTNQHAGLSQALADQRISERREQAAQARLGRDARPPRRRRAWVPRRWWQLARWPGVATDQPVTRPPNRPLIDRRHPCPNAPAHSSWRPWWRP